jgi:hypothetical protein
MGSTGLCLSDASILRCESFTLIQSEVLIAPVGLALIFSLALIFTNRYTSRLAFFFSTMTTRAHPLDRRFLLITVEGLTYFCLSLLDLLSHLLPAVRDNLSIFQTVDLVLAATSFLPLLLYSLFLLLFTRAELIDIIPTHLRTVSVLSLALFIPAIVALNELASFLGVSRRCQYFIPFYFQSC